MQPVVLPAATTVGPVSLTVADLDRSIEYHVGTVGLELLARDGDTAHLGVGAVELLELVEVPGARQVPGATGLYHFALRVPERADLAAWLAHAARDRVALTGLSDHFVSEAIYLTDPDGHGIEIYWDRPRSVWEGQVGARMTTLALDVEDLFGVLDDPATAPFSGLATGTRMGHVHLRVADVAETVGFYRDVLGFELMASIAHSAAFLAAGGYHHHLGANIWESRGGAPPAPGSAALRWATIEFPDVASRDAALERVSGARGAVEDGPRGPVVRDPSGNALVLTVAG